MIHTVKNFSVVNKAEVDVFLKFLCFLCDPANVGNLISNSSAFPQPSFHFWKFSVNVLLKSNLKDLSIALLACEMSAVVRYFEHSLALPFFGIIGIC